MCESVKCESGRKYNTLYNGEKIGEKFVNL